MAARIITAVLLLLGLVCLSQAPVRHSPAVIFSSAKAQLPLTHGGRGTQSAGGGVATAFTNTLPTNDSGDQGVTFRTVTTVVSAIGGLGQVRVTFKASTGSPTRMHLDHASFGKSTGTTSGIVAGPDELFFIGAGQGPHGFDIASGTITSDWLTVSGGNSFAISDSVVVVSDYNSTAAHGNPATGTGISGLTTYLASAQASYNLLTTGGGFSTNAGIDWGVMKIETQ